MLREWSQHEHPTIFQFEHGLRCLAVLIAHGEAMEALDPNLLDLGIGFRGAILYEAGICTTDHEWAPISCAAQKNS